MKRAQRHAGFTLVELMVAAVIFLGVSIVIFTTLANSEGQKRTTTAINDINQEGAYVMYRLGNWLRDAGSGFAQNYLQAYGCKINAARSGTVIMPPTSLPPPFAGIVGSSSSGGGSSSGSGGSSSGGTTGYTLRLVPVIIFKNLSQSGSDIIMLMSGNGGMEQNSQPLISVPNSSSGGLSPAQSYTIKTGDLLLLSDLWSGSNMSDCLLEQVNATGYTAGSTPIPISSSTYYYAGPSGKSLTSYSVNGAVTNIGSSTSTTTNWPNFTLIGVGPSASSAQNNSLYAYDLLQNGGATTSVTVADNVLEMHALYGLDSGNRGVVDQWVDPSSSGYTAANLLDGTLTARQKLCMIKAIRVGIIMRTDISDKTDVGQPNTITLFSDLGSSLTYTYTLTSGTTKTYRYRAMETTIPLRNNYLIGNPCQ